MDSYPSRIEKLPQEQRYGGGPPWAKMAKIQVVHPPGSFIPLLSMFGDSFRLTQKKISWVLEIPVLQVLWHSSVWTGMNEACILEVVDLKSGNVGEFAGLFRLTQVWYDSGQPGKQSGRLNSAQDQIIFDGELCFIRNAYLTSLSIPSYHIGKY